MQPIIRDEQNVVRFQVNAIVDLLLEESSKRGFSLNNLVAMSRQKEFSQTDWEQFYQLIGYSLSGYHELNNVSDAAAKEATKAARKLFGKKIGGCRDENCPIHCGVKREE